MKRKCRDCWPEPVGLLVKWLIAEKIRREEQKAKEAMKYKMENLPTGKKRMEETMEIKHVQKGEDEHYPIKLSVDELNALYRLLRTDVYRNWESGFEKEKRLLDAMKTAIGQQLLELDKPNKPEEYDPLRNGL